MDDVVHGELVPVELTSASRDERILDAYEAGLDAAELSEAWGLSEDRIRQIVRVQRALEGERAAARGGPMVRRADRQAEVDQTVLWPEEVEETMRAGIAPNTWIAYRQQWAQFKKWCEHFGNRTPLPASHETLISYVKWMQRTGLSPSTIRIAMAALKFRHGFGDPPPEWAGATRPMKLLLLGYEKTCARDPARAPKRAAAARSAIMRALVDTCDPETSRGIQDRAALLLSYYMAARRSELANLRLADLRYTVDGLEIFIAYSKTDQTGQDAPWVAVPANTVHPEYDPVRSVQAWVKVLRDEGVTSGPLFRAIRATGKIRHNDSPVSGTTFEGIWNRAVATARAKAEATGDERMQNLLAARLTPHSGRKAFATDARANGWDLIDITRHGRWSPQSKVVHIYIEEVDKWLRHQNKPIQL